MDRFLCFPSYYPNVEEALEKLFQQFSRIVFGKEAYPNVWMNLGPGSLAAYLGAEIKFTPELILHGFEGHVH